MTTQISNLSQQTVREEWVAACERLISQIETWATELNCRPIARIFYSTSGKPVLYTVPTVRVRLPGRAEIHVTPIARGIPGAMAALTWRAGPRCTACALIRRDGDTWEAITDSNVRLREPGRANSYESGARSHCDMTSWDAFQQVREIRDELLAADFALTLSIRKLKSIQTCWPPQMTSSGLRPTAPMRVEFGIDLSASIVFDV